MGQEARDHTPPPVAPFHSLHFPFYSFSYPSKNLPPHMVGKVEPHPLIERGWGYNRVWDGCTEPPGLFQLQSDWYQMMKPTASHINIHHSQGICPWGAMAGHWAPHTYSIIQLVEQPAIQHVGGWNTRRIAWVRLKPEQPKKGAVMVLQAFIS